MTEKKEQVHYVATFDIKKVTRTTTETAYRNSAEPPPEPKRDVADLAHFVVKAAELHRLSEQVIAHLQVIDDVATL